MSYKLAELGNTIRAQLLRVMTGETIIDTSRSNTFVTWVTPAYAFQPSAFDFAIGGINSAKSAEEQRRFAHQAWQFSVLMDYIPDISGLLTLDKQMTVHRPSQERLSHIYEQILRFSKVAPPSNPEEIARKIRKWQDERNELEELYEKYQVDYLKERLKYSAKKIAAMSAVGPEGRKDVIDWQANESIYRQFRDHAASKWDGKGQRNRYEELGASISQTSIRSMKLWKQDLVNKFKQAHTSVGDPAIWFPYTQPIPGDFANSDSWESYKIYDKQTNSEINRKSEDWGSGGKARWGFWSGEHDVQKHSSSYSENYSISEFELTFDITQVLIARPWFFPEFFKNRGWNLTIGSDGWHFPEFPSDGQNPPKGNFVGYASTALFARNVKIRSREFVSAYREFKESLKIDVAVGWGPFTFKGNYQKTESGESFESQDSETTLTVPGMHLTAFVNKLIPKSPNPLENLDVDTFE